jgi:integrase
MTTAAPSTALATIQPAFTDAERLALAGFLAGYRGLTRDAYALDLRQFTTWYRARSLALFTVRRTDIESFARELEARGRARATVTRRLCTIAGFYKYAVEEELIEHSPAAHVRRPRVDYESHATALDRNELGALLVAAGLGSALEHALISLLALNGLRVSEATAADIEHLGLERGHRTLMITRKGGKVSLRIRWSPSICGKRWACPFVCPVGESRPVPGGHSRARAGWRPSGTRPGAPLAIVRHTADMGTLTDYFSAPSDESAASALDRVGGPGQPTAGPLPMPPFDTFQSGPVVGHAVCTWFGSV